MLLVFIWCDLFPILNVLQLMEKKLAERWEILWDIQPTNKLSKKCSGFNKIAKTIMSKPKYLISGQLKGYVFKKSTQFLVIDDF